MNRLRVRSRAPFGRASVEQVAKTRALVAAYRDWERAMLTPDMTLSPRVPAFARHGIPVEVEARIAARTEQRLAERPDAADIAAARRDLLARTRAPEQWVKDEALRRLAGIHHELARIRELMEHQAGENRPCPGGPCLWQYERHRDERLGTGGLGDRCDDRRALQR